ncbi:MAG: sporulation transcriptional regulator SpoIIID [Oscillospiraceae bacterium]
MKVKCKENDDILCDRAIILGKYILENKATVRACAEHFSYEFGISKSTVHKDVTQKLAVLKPDLYVEVKEILEINKKERHIRGGMATKKKYENLKRRAAACGS